MKDSKNKTDTVSSAIAAAASLTDKPFKVAFMATLGVGMAQLLMLIVFFGGVGTLIFLASLILTSLK